MEYSQLFDGKRGYIVARFQSSSYKTRKLKTIFTTIRRNSSKKNNTSQKIYNK